MNPSEPNPKANRIDPVDVFVGAIANEMHRDSYIFKKFPVCRYTSLVLPRLEKMSYLAKTFPRSLAFIAHIGSTLWLPLLYPALLVFQAARALSYLTSAGGDIKGEIFFVVSRSSLIFSRSSAFKGKHIHASKKLERSNPTHEQIGSISDYVILPDIVTAFKNSIRAILRVRDTCSMPGGNFQVYSAFAWFLTWSVMSRHSRGLTSVWISNDCDRWAVLFDQLPRNGQLIIIQHGLLNDPPGHQGFRNWAALPTRLKNVDKIILFDKQSQEKYRNLVLDRDCHPDYIYSQVISKQTNTELNGCGAARVMIIGQRGHLNHECELANYLCRKLDSAHVYIRPHPNTSSSEYKSRLDPCVVLIDDLYQYPFVDLCMCFDYSSLGYIYEKQGVRVLYLKDINMSPSAWENVRKQILEHMDLHHENLTHQ